MKTLKFTLAFVIIAFFASSHVLIGQTFQLYPKGTLTNSMVWCLNKELSGYVIYHLTYHVDKATGLVDRMHGNIHEAELHDSEGIKYIILDTGNDNSGVSWAFWNETTMGGTNTITYDQQSYQLPIGPLSKGGNVWANFKFISKGGEKVSIHWLTRFIINSDGDTEVVFDKVNMDCNE